MLFVLGNSKPQMFSFSIKVSRDAALTASFSLELILYKDSLTLRSSLSRAMCSIIFLDRSKNKIFLSRKSQ